MAVSRSYREELEDQKKNIVLPKISRIWLRFGCQLPNDMLLMGEGMGVFSLFKSA